MSIFCGLSGNISFSLIHLNKSLKTRAKTTNGESAINSQRYAILMRLSNAKANIAKVNAIALMISNTA
jgi:hypothetical protein